MSTVRFRCCLCDQLYPPSESCSISKSSLASFPEGTESTVCNECVRTHIPNVLNRGMFSAGQTCDICNDKHKPWSPPFAHFNVPKIYSQLFDGSRVNGCYYCVFPTIVNVIAAFLESPDSKGECPECKTDNGSSTINLVSVLCMGHVQIFTCCDSCVVKHSVWKSVAEPSIGGD